MNIKELKEFLNQFPEDTFVTTQANGHYSLAGIFYADFFEIEGNEKFLCIGNSDLLSRRQGYNVRGFKLIQRFNYWDYFK